MSYWRYEELDNGRSSEHSQYGGRVVSNFYGGRDPRAFQDWLDALEDFFGWIGSSPNRKVHFVKMALKGEAYEWWHSVEEYHHRLRLPPIADWEEMKFKLKEKYGDNCYIQQQRDSALIHALNQVRLCTARLDDGFTRIFSGKAQPSITDLHKPQQTKTQPSLISKPLELSVCQSLHHPQSPQIKQIPKPKAKPHQTFRHNHCAPTSHQKVQTL